MGKILNICIVVFVLLVVIFIVWINWNQSLLIKKMDKDLTWSERRISILKHHMIDTWKFDKTAVNMDAIYDEEGNKLDTASLNALSPVLIFKFSKINCMDCVVKQIDVIKEFMQYDRMKSMMICDYDNKRELGLFKRTNAIKNQVYCSKKLFNNEHRTPYFGVYFNGFITDIFFPEAEVFPELTTLYLEEINKKYFSR